MTTERDKRMIFSLGVESNHAPPAFRADVLTTVLERSVDHSFRSVLCSKGNISDNTIRSLSTKRLIKKGGEKSIYNKSKNALDVFFSFISDGQNKGPS